MTDQTTLLPRFAREIVVQETGYSIREVLEEMATRDYSQVLVRVVPPYQAYRDEQQEENGGPGGRTYPLRLLTHEAVARYVRACWDDDYVDLKHIGIEDVLSDEPDGTMVIMAGDRTIGDARAGSGRGHRCLGARAHVCALLFLSNTGAIPIDRQQGGREREARSALC